MSQNILVGSVAQGNLIQIVALHELIENIGTENHSLRNGNLSIIETLELLVAYNHIVDERQATSLSAQRTVADARKVRETVETVALELGNNSPVSHLAVFNDGIVDNLTMRIHILKTLPSDVLQKFRNREKGSRAKPA